MDDLERMKAEFAAKGGTVKVLPATKYETITNDDSRTKYWGEGIDTKDNKKIKDTLRNQGLTVVEIPEQRNEYGGIIGAVEGTKTCNRCHQRKEKSEYWGCVTGKDGLMAKCRDCAKKHHKTVAPEVAKGRLEVRRQREVENTPEEIHNCPKEKLKVKKLKQDRDEKTKYFGKVFEIDHIWPLSKGGPDWSGNMVVVTRGSNRKKASSVSEETIERISKALNAELESIKNGK